MKSAIAIRHVHFEDLGTLAPILKGAGYQVRYVDVCVDDIAAVDPVESDLVIVLGGPIGAYEDELYPTLKDELTLLEKRLAMKRPTLGICLGAQLMARALGARVYPTGGKEIGWGPVTLSAAGRESAFRHLGQDGVAVLHWHGDTFDLPRDATLLASTGFCRSQAYAWGAKVVGFFIPRPAPHGSSSGSSAMPARSRRPGFRSPHCAPTPPAMHRASKSKHTKASRSG